MKKRMKLDTYFTSHRKMNSKWTIDLHVRAKTIKLIEENIGVNLCDFGSGNNVLDTTPKVQVTKEKISWIT